MDLLDVIRALNNETSKLERWLESMPTGDPIGGAVIFGELFGNISDAILKEYNIPKGSDHFSDIIFDFSEGRKSKEEAVKELKSFDREKYDIGIGEKMSNIFLKMLKEDKSKAWFADELDGIGVTVEEFAAVWESCSNDEKMKKNNFNK